MEWLQIVANIIFLGSIVLVITGWIDSVIAAILGIIIMILFGVMTEVQAFQFVNWNVILILLGIWIRNKKKNLQQFFTDGYNEPGLGVSTF